MNYPRLVLAIIVGYIFCFASDFAVHGWWTLPDYKATASLWRPNAEMQAHMP